jgi:F-type H+-transporting ATPase subunit b
MAIDWFTVGAQIINFLILVWLLKKFLYRPITEAMHSREQGLVTRLQQSQASMAEAEQLKNQYQTSLEQLHNEADNIRSDAKQQAEAERLVQLQALDDDMQQKKNRFAEELQRQQQATGVAIKQLITEKALQLSGKILEGLASQRLEQQITHQFLQHLDTLPDEQQARLQQALSQDGAAIISSAFSLDESVCQIIRERLIQAGAGNVVFEQDPHLVCGITLEAGGRSWEWTLERYLAELDSELS